MPFKQPSGRLGLGAYIAYSIPALPMAAFAVPIYIYIPPFYAQELGISLAAIGTVLTLARIIDAFAQPVIGRWVTLCAASCENAAAPETRCGS
ncbi:MAG: hypothetical protein Dbin4_01163 [Alphaproteobacteria bacterium]|nr:hypothetical protein [Alphaproteobacteria bacterium]